MGVVLVTREPGSYPEASAQPPRGPVAGFMPLDPERPPRRLVIAWEDSTQTPLIIVRSVPRWELVDDEPHARVEYRLDFQKRPDLFQVEWLREDPQGRIVASRRQIGAELYVLDPPMPVLVPPLEPGQRWRWEGTVGGQAASSEFSVRAFSPGQSGARRFEVTQALQLGGRETKRFLLVEEGVGLVEERALTLQGDLEHRLGEVSIEPPSEEPG